MIKWQISAEKIHYLRIMKEVATHWKTLGGLLKISSAILESYETECMKKNCMRAVFKKWIEATSEEVRQVSVDFFCVKYSRGQNDSHSVVLNNLQSCFHVGKNTWGDFFFLNVPKFEVDE